MILKNKFNIIIGKMPKITISKSFYILIALYSISARAEDGLKYPFLSGDILIENRSDHIYSRKTSSNLKTNNSFFYVENNSNLHINQFWQIKTNWRLQPNNVITTRNVEFPERYRTILQNNRSIGMLDRMGLIAEEIKINFENEDLIANIGKFDPTFGTAHFKSKKLGVFTRDFTEDYNLREKIGGNLNILLENSQISLNSFFNDTTPLSESAINNRGQASQNQAISGNNGNLSSYSVNLKTSKTLGFDNWFSNLGYRSLGVKNALNNSREFGVVLNSEYLWQYGRMSIVPFVELVKINNFTGEKDRNALYSTTAMMLRYNNWNMSGSFINRNIKSKIKNYSIRDYQAQISVGYKFKNGFAIDLTRANIKESSLNSASRKASLIGANLSYLYKF